MDELGLGTKFAFGTNEVYDQKKFRTKTIQWNLGGVSYYIGKFPVLTKLVFIN
jgi:hypothetical protein